MRAARDALPSYERRLLMLVPWAMPGGADRFNIDLAAELGARGWATTFVMTESAAHSWLAEYERVSEDVVILPRLVRPREYPVSLRELARSRRPDAILVTHSPFGYNALQYIRSIAGGAPIVDFTHIDDHDWYDGGYARMSADHSRELDLQITSSEYLKDWLVAHGSDRNRIEVCYTGAALELEPAVGRDELGVPDETPIVLYPCRIVHQKQPAVFAKTVRELRRRGCDLVALVAGDGPLLPWLRTWVRRNGLEDVVRFLGDQPNERVKGIMQASDVLFLPSHNEGIAISLFEAMARGLPVVAADVGGQRELVTADCGVLVERGSEDEEVARYAAALEGFLRDPDARRRTGDAARARIAAAFQLDAMGTRMEALLEHARALAASEPRPIPSPAEAARSAQDAVSRAPFTSLGPVVSTDVRLWRLRVVLLRALVFVGSPAYQLALRHGLGWIEPVKHRLVRTLNPRPQSR